MVTYSLLKENEDQVSALQNFARRCALRAIQQSISGANFCQTMPGLYQWLNTGKLSYTRMSELYIWRDNHDIVWEHGDAEAAVWYALLAEESTLPIAGWAYMASQHAIKLLGRREEKKQERSLKILVRKTDTEE